METMEWGDYLGVASSFLRFSEKALYTQVVGNGNYKTYV